MKRTLKKMLSLVVATALVILMGTVKNAEAAGCPPHGPYEERMMDGYQWREYHYPEVTVLGTDEFGNQIPIYDSNGNPFTVKCLMTSYRYHIGIYCSKGKCNWLLNDYHYETPVLHSYCSVG